MITNEEILQKYNDPKIKSVWVFPYGAPFILCASPLGDFYQPSEIIKIDKSKLELNSKKDCFIFRWGFPNDSNIYRFTNYGRTWAFDEDWKWSKEVMNQHD